MDIADVITAAQSEEYPSQAMADAVTDVIMNTADAGLALQALLAAAAMAEKVNDAALTANMPSAALLRPYPGYPSSKLRAWALDVVAHLHAEAASAESFRATLEDAHWRTAADARYHWHRMAQDEKAQYIAHARGLENTEHRLEQAYAHPSMASIWDDAVQEFLFGTTGQDRLVERNGPTRIKEKMALCSLGYGCHVWTLYQLYRNS